MGLFRKISNIFNPKQRLSDELDRVVTPSEAILDGWLGFCLTEDNRAYLVATAKTLGDTSVQYRYYALVRHLFRPPHYLTIQAASDIAKKKAAPLLARYEHITENEWTDAELDQWLESLDEPHRNSIDDGVRTYRAKGFTNVSQLLCKIRRSAIHREAVDRAQAPSLLHMLYEFNDERSKVEVHRAAQNFNKYFGK